VSKRDVPSPSPSSIIYTTADDVRNAYAAIHSNNTQHIEKSSSVKDVYIPADVLTVPAAQKGIVHHDYNIEFYENEYKRVVMWHLSKFHNVYFYR
jgi:F0F1-type ATP synthase beta subunit